MKKCVYLALGGLLLIAALFSVWPATAQVKQDLAIAETSNPTIMLPEDREVLSGLRLQPGKAPEGSENAFQQSGPEEFQDPGFNRYVNISNLPDLINSGDLVALTDFGLHLAEGERVLHRKHRAKITSRAVLKLVASLAEAEKDVETLKRIQLATSSYQDVALTETLKGKLDKPRVDEPWMKVHAVNEDIKQFTTLRGLLGDIRRATAIGDRDRLKELEKVAGKMTSLSADQKEGLQKLAQENGSKMTVDSDQKIIQETMQLAQRYAACILYQHSWGGGATWTIWGSDTTGLGEFSTSFMRAGWNDVVSSIWIRNGQTLYGYQHDGYGGASFWITVARNGFSGSSHNYALRQVQAGFLFEIASAGNWNDHLSSYKLRIR